MTNRKISYLAVPVLIISIVVVILLFYIKPYSVPPVDKEIDSTRYNLDFSLEKATSVTEEYQKIILLLNGSEDQQNIGLDLLKNNIEQQPDNMAYTNILRLHMNSTTHSEDFEQFITNLPENPRLTLQLALFYVDQLQNPDLGIAALGQKSSQSILYLNEILEKNPYDLLAHYARGLNNLYWPSGLQRTEKSIQDLQFCYQVTRELEEEDPSFWLWPLIYVAYGDALIKNGDIKDGMKIWVEGYSKYADYEELEHRAILDENQAFELVRSARGVEIFQRPDEDITDIGKLWNK